MATIATWTDYRSPDCFPFHPPGDDSQQGNEQSPGNAFGTQQRHGYAGKRTTVRRDASRTQNKKVGRRKDGKGERHGTQTARRPQSVGWERPRPSVMENATRSPMAKSLRSVRKTRYKSKEPTGETEHRCPESDVEFQVFDKRTHDYP